MKRIIRGKRYDTETAVYVGRGESDCGKSDFRWYVEDLYKTPRSGVFFLEGEGGPMTTWARRVDGGYTDGHELRPLTREDALRWAEANLKPSAIEEHFSDLVEDA